MSTWNLFLEHKKVLWRSRKNSSHLCILIDNLSKIEPFKLFGGDDDDDAQQEPRVLFADNEEEKELDTDTPAIREKVGTHSRHACMHETGKTYISGMQIHFDLGVLFFFHADDPELMQK